MTLLALVALAAVSAPDAVYLRHEAEIGSPSPGSYLEVTRETIVPLTGRGVSRYGTMSVSFRSTWESVEVLRAEVRHWRAGRGESLAEVREEPHDMLLPGGRLESSLRELILTFPGLEVGDTILVEVARSIDSLPMGDFYHYAFYPAGRDSIRSGRLAVTWPDHLPLHSSWNGEDADTMLVDGDIRLTWTTGPSSPLPAGQFAPDPYASPRIEVAGSLPEEVSEGLHAFMDPGPPDGELAEAAGQLLLDAGGSPLALRDRVAGEVDFLGADWGSTPGYSPRPPLTTLRDRAGVCRDGAVLLLQLLRLAGFEPHLVMTSTRGAIGELVGSRSFDHVLVAIRGEDRISFLDPSMSRCYDGFTYSLRGRGYLPLLPDGAALEEFPSSSVFGDTLRITLAGSLSAFCDTLSGSISLTATGAAEELYASMLGAVAPSERGRLLRVLTGAFPGSTLSVLTGEDDPPGSFRAGGEGSWPVACSKLSGEGVRLAVVPGARDLDVVVARAAAMLLPGERDWAEVLVQTPYVAVTDIRIALPIGVSAEPAGAPAETFGGYEATLRTTPDSVLLREVCPLVPMRPGPGELQPLLDGLLATISSSHRAVLLR